MADWKDRSGGGYGAYATQFLVSTATSIQAVPTNNNRIAVAFHNFGAAPLFLGYGQVATSTQSFPLVPSQALVERDYLGPINVAAASGATGLVAIKDIGF